MATVNTNTDLLIPELWAAQFDQQNIGSYGLQSQVSSKTELGPGQAGDTLHVPLTPDLGYAQEGWDLASPSAVTQETVTVSLDTPLQGVIKVARKELTLPAYAIIEKWAPAVVKSILKSVNRHIYKQMILSNYLVDARSTFNETTLLSAVSILDVNEVNESDRFACFAPDDFAAMMGFAAFSHANIAGTAESIQRGVLTQRYGLQFCKNHEIRTYTPADLAGAIDKVGDYTSADFTIVVDAFDDDANPVRGGDIFQVADESGTPLHVVQSTTLTSSDTTGITFLTKHDQSNGAKVNDKVITVIPTRSGLVFRADGVAFGAKPFAPIPSSLGVQSSVMNIAGLPVCVTLMHDGGELIVQYALVVGCKIVDRKRVVRVLRA